MTYFLDASVLVALHKQEASTESVKEWFSANTTALVSSYLSIGEARSAFSRQVRKRLWGIEDASRATAKLDQWVALAVDLVALQDSDIRDAASIVLQPLPRLLMPDAIHLAICKRLDLTLVTLDVDLLTIAAREGVTAILPA